MGNVQQFQGFSVQNQTFVSPISKVSKETINFQNHSDIILKENNVNSLKIYMQNGNLFVQPWCEDKQKWGSYFNFNKFIKRDYKQSDISDKNSQENDTEFTMCKESQKISQSAYSFDEYEESDKTFFNQKPSDYFCGYLSKSQIHKTEQFFINFDQIIQVPNGNISYHNNKIIMKPGTYQITLTVSLEYNKQVELVIFESLKNGKILKRLSGQVPMLANLGNTSYVSLTTIVSCKHTSDFQIKIKTSDHQQIQLTSQTQITILQLLDSSLNNSQQ